MPMSPTWRLFSAGMATAGLTTAAVLAGVGGPRTAVEPIELTDGVERSIVTNQSGALIRPLGADGSLAAPTLSPDSVPSEASAASERSASASVESRPAALVSEQGARAVPPGASASSPSVDSPVPASQGQASPPSPDSPSPESFDSPSPESVDSPSPDSVDSPSSPSVDSA